MARIALILSLLLAACASLPGPAERRLAADALARAQGWQASEIAAGEFDLVSYAPAAASRGAALTVYVEGDGLAWLATSQPSPDPTPQDPLALRLALKHPAGNAAYLARPCQYVGAAARNCSQRYWTDQRFAPAVIEASSRALDAIKARFGATQLVLVGYSGGGAVAALLAARRDDVVRLVTVAGNLDHRRWTEHHRVSPLAGSLNAADVADSLVKLPQTHFIGGRDRVISPELANELPGAIRGIGNRNLRVVPDYDHQCCWADHWARLWSSEQ